MGEKGNALPSDASASEAAPMQQRTGEAPEGAGDGSGYDASLVPYLSPDVIPMTA